MFPSFNLTLSAVILGSAMTCKMLPMSLATAKRNGWSESMSQLMFLFPLSYSFGLLATSITKFLSLGLFNHESSPFSFLLLVFFLLHGLAHTSLLFCHPGVCSRSVRQDNSRQVYLYKTIHTPDNSKCNVGRRGKGRTQTPPLHLKRK